MADALKEILNASVVRKASYASPHASDERDEAVEDQVADQEALPLQHRHRELIRTLCKSCLPATKSRMRASCTMHFDEKPRGLVGLRPLSTCACPAARSRSAIGWPA